MKAILIEHFRRYPKMQIQDAVKLIYQHEFAGSHMLQGNHGSWLSVESEILNLDSTGGLLPQKFESIGNSLCRMHLAAMTTGDINYSTMDNMFVSTAHRIQGKQDRFIEQLKVLESLCRDGKCPFDSALLNAFMDNYKLQEYPALHHSESYRKAYSPAYRVVSADFNKFFDVFVSIDRLMATQDQVLVAIDGRCAAGKSTLADLIQSVYDCNVFHLDDYFLRPEQRTPERLGEIGGNVDHERFSLEIFTKLTAGQPFEYAPYDCSVQQLGPPVSVTPKKLNVIEGSYSMRPAFLPHYDLKIFMDIDPVAQFERIQARNGLVLSQRFADEWIPMEERYFDQIQIRQHCDLHYMAGSTA